MYIYIYRERERERDSKAVDSSADSNLETKVDWRREPTIRGLYLFEVSIREPTKI